MIRLTVRVQRKGSIMLCHTDSECPIKNDTVTLSHNFRLNYPNSKTGCPIKNDTVTWVITLD